jgi:hypothetical protein
MTSQGETAVRLERVAAYRRALQLGLGVMWLLDAALQFQPYMFTSAFPHEVLAPTGPGNPGWVAAPVHWAAHLTAGHVVWLNALFATGQLLIALGLFTRSTVRLALAGSVVWGLSVWWLGEGFGGLLAAAQSPVMGAPGAALLYVVVSVLVWPPRDADRLLNSGTVAVALASPMRRVGAKVVWSVLWLGFAAESVQAANRAPSALHDLVSGMQDGEPGWLRSLDRAAANTLAGHGAGVSIALAVCCVLIAASVWAGDRATRIGLGLSVVLAALIWVVGENLGEIATGEATDPNTGPMLVLLAAAYWPLRRNPVTLPDRDLTQRQLAGVGVQPSAAS